jgi:hypothetical protein
MLLGHFAIFAWAGVAEWRLAKQLALFWLFHCLKSRQTN